jgi:glyoxylase-like metal-dependent hydrolase (beta-lactamase superfamily II)
MQKILIKDNFYMYHFNVENDILGLNIYCLVDNNKALLIDAGFEAQMKEVIKDLELNNYKIKTVIPTHFHGDHISGLKLLSNVEVIGLKEAKSVLSYWFDDYDFYLPNNLIDKETILSFGDFDIRIVPNIGHSKDGVLIFIDDKYICVGDEMLYTNSCEQVIPHCFELGYEKHISSTERLIEYAKNRIILPAHGKVLEDQAKIFEDLNKILIYLNYIKDNKSENYQDFFNQTGISFKREGFHRYNIINDLVTVRNIVLKK